jgi:hypothetical protein
MSARAAGGGREVTGVTVSLLLGGGALRGLAELGLGVQFSHTLPLFPLPFIRSVPLGDPSRAREMGIVRYKFKGRAEPETLTFDGQFITLLELKRMIASKAKLDTREANASAELIITDPR